MTLRQFLARLTGAAADSATQEEFRRLAREGDEARRQKAWEAAEAAYNAGLTLARERKDAPGEEVFMGLLGALYSEQGDFDRARTILLDALNRANLSAEAYRRARASLNLGAYHLLKGELETARQVLEQSLALARQATDPTTIALAAANLADLYTKQNNPQYVVRVLKDAILQTVQVPTQASGLLGRMGKALLAIGDIERGRQMLQQAVMMAQQNEQPELQATWSAALAEQLMKEGRPEEALRQYAEVEALVKRGVLAELPTSSDLTATLNQASALQALGQTDRAAELAHKALEQAQSGTDWTAQASALLTVGHSEQRAGRLEDAIAAVQNALNLYETHTEAAALNQKPEFLNGLVTLGALYQEQGDTERAMQQFDRVLALTGDDNRQARGQTLRQIGSLLQKQGNLSGALERYTQAVALFDADGAHAQAARLLCETGALRRQLSGINAAILDFERASMLLNNVKDVNTRGYVLSNVANIYTDLGEIDTARAFYQESIHLARQTASRRNESLRLGNYGWFHIMIGQPNQALPLLEEALAISRTLDDPLLVAVQTSNLGLAHHDLKAYDAAERAFREALTLAENRSETRWKSTFESNLGRTLIALGRHDEALAVLTRALADSRTSGDQETLARTQVRLGEFYLKLNRLDEADTAAREGEAISRKLGYRRGHADALIVRAGIADARGDAAEYLTHLREARRLYAILHDPIAQDLANVVGDE